MSIAIACEDFIFKNIAAVIFDKDGTLENSLAYWREVGTERARLVDAQIPGVGEPLKMAFGILDNEIDPQGLIAVGSRQENEIAAAAYIAETGRSWQEARKIAASAFEEVAESKYLTKTVESAPLYEDVRDILRLLNDKGIKLGILSADSTAAVENFVVNHQLQEYICLSMGADEQIIKPDPQLFWQACKSLAVAPEQTLMIGDSGSDMNMAKAAGAAGAIGICRDRIRRLYLADITINSLEKIQTF